MELDAIPSVVVVEAVITEEALSACLAQEQSLMRSMGKYSSGGDQSLSEKFTSDEDGL